MVKNIYVQIYSSYFGQGLSFQSVLVGEVRFYRLIITLRSVMSSTTFL